jgi:hypothetical protein
MRQHEDFSSVGSRAWEFELATEVVSKAPARQSLHAGGAVNAAGKKVHEAVDGLRLIARRLAPDQLADERDDGGLLRFRKSKKRMHCLL